jgi:hypothetical protein
MQVHFIIGDILQKRHTVLSIEIEKFYHQTLKYTPLVTLHILTMEHHSRHIAKEKVTVRGGRDTKGGAPVQKHKLQNHGEGSWL